MNPHYPLVAQHAGHRCEYCHAPEAIFNFPFEVEHVIPNARQGRDDESNLALACRACNLHKGDYLSGIDPLTQSEELLFHPQKKESKSKSRIKIRKRIKSKIKSKSRNPWQRPDGCRFDLEKLELHRANRILLLLLLFLLIFFLILIFILILLFWA